MPGRADDKAEANGAASKEEGSGGGDEKAKGRKKEKKEKKEGKKEKKDKKEKRGKDSKRHKDKDAEGSMKAAETSEDAVPKKAPPGEEPSAKAGSSPLPE